MKQLETLKVQNQNPRAGKGKIVLGKLLEFGGICLTIGGVCGFFNEQIGSGSNGGNDSYLFILESGAVTFVGGYIIDKIGRFQHWYNN